MVLRDDTINQQLLIPLDLRDLIPKDHPCFFIKNVVDTMDFTEIHKKYEGKPGESAYSRAMLLRVTLMGAFDGGLSSRELEEQVNTNIAYMYLAGMQKPDFRTFARFKQHNGDLINQAFIKSIEIAREADLIKLHKIAFDGTKIKAKSSLNNITDKEQLKILKDNLKRSIELDEEEDELFGDESGNSVPNSLINKKEFQKISEKIDQKSKNDRNQEKLRASSKKLLKKASKSKKDAEQVLNQIDNLEQKLDESGKDIISISDSDARLMINKKGRWEFCYNYQIGVDAENGLIVSTGLTQNPADFNELQPQIEKLESIVGPLAPNTQILADNGYSTDEATDFLEQKSLDGYIASRKLARKDKNLINVDKPFSKDHFTYSVEKGTYICPLGQILENQNEYKIRENKRKIVYWSNNCKNCPKQLECVGKYRYRTITDYGTPSKIRMQRKMEEDWAQEIYSLRSQVAELPFADLKHNIKFNEFTTTGLERCDTELKLMATGYNFKRILNKINKKSNS